MKTKATAKDVMTKEVVVVRESATLAHAWKKLHENKITGAPVVDEDGDLVGVISQTDLLREALEDTEGSAGTNGFYYEMPYMNPSYWPVLSDKLHSVLVEEAMNQEVITAETTDEVTKIASKMRANRIHRVVITEKGKLAGLVTSLDILKVLEAQ